VEKLVIGTKPPRMLVCRLIRDWKTREERYPSSAIRRIFGVMFVCVLHILFFLCHYVLVHVIGGITVQLSCIFQPYTRKTALISYMSRVFSGSVGDGCISISFRPRFSRLYTLLMHLFLRHNALFSNTVMLLCLRPLISQTIRKLTLWHIILTTQIIYCVLAIVMHRLARNLKLREVRRKAYVIHVMRRYDGEPSETRQVTLLKPQRWGLKMSLEWSLNYGPMI
jgi:hypothetical protein